MGRSWFWTLSLTMLLALPAAGSPLWKCEFAPLSPHFVVSESGRASMRGHVADATGFKPMDYLLSLLSRPLGIRKLETYWQEALKDPRDIPMSDKLLDAMQIQVHLGPRERIDVRDLSDGESANPGLVGMGTALQGTAPLSVGLSGVAKLAASHSLGAAGNRGGEQRPSVVGSSPQLEKFPKEGGVLITMNHPHMGIEALAMMRALRGIRSDVKIIMSPAFDGVPGIGENGFSVRSGTYGNRAVAQVTKQATEWLADGHVVIMFPSGKLSYRQKGEQQSKDPEWQRGASYFVERVLKKNPDADLHVVPAFVEGQPSGTFQTARRHLPGVVSNLLMLPEFRKREGTHMHLSVGEPIRAKELPKENPTEFLRALTYAHAGDYVSKPKETQRPADVRPSEKIAEPMDPATIASEVDAVRKAGGFLVEKGGLETFEATPEQIPTLLKEIGRLREITFRSAGEGTGKSRDLDEFDPHYRHIFVWDPEAKRVVGAYRLGLGGEIMAKQGPAGFSNSKLFEMNPMLEEVGKESIELGRTFIQPDYQKNRYGLFLLWRGIGEFMARNPQYKGFFGPVSMSANYTGTSQQILMDWNMRHHGHPRAKELAQPRNPAEGETMLTPSEVEAINTNLTDIRQVANLIGSVEPDGKPMPMLYRQYLQFNPKYIAWTRNPHFNSVTGLIYVDMTKAPRSAVDRYMGKEGAEGFLQAHGVGSPKEGESE